MTAILAADLLVADVIVQLAGNAKLAALVASYGLQSGGKANLDREHFDAMASAVAGHAVTIAPGGSSANMLVTLSRLMGKEVNVRLIGIAGEGLSSNMIRASLTEANIELLPKTLPPGTVAQTAVSYVIVFPEGQRTIATWPGNARELLTPEVITDVLVKASDVVLLQGSLWRKFAPAFPEKLLALCASHRKRLWLTLPTQTPFSAKEAAHFRELVSQADLLLGNDSELARVYELSPAQALEPFQKALSAHATAFITCGERGAFVVTAAAITPIAPAAIAKGDIVNTLGAGDTAFAGFAAGRLKGLSALDSARIAETLAAEKLRLNAPRLNDPRASLFKALPELAKHFS